MAKAKKLKEDPIEVPAPVEEQVNEFHPNPEPIINEEPIVVETPEPEPVKEEPTVVIEQETTMEQKIIDFIDSRGTGEVRMNEFIKSLYPPVSYANPAKWLELGENKRLRNTLDGLVKQGALRILNDMHLRLASIYYDQEGRTNHHNLNTVQLVAVK